MEVSRATQFDHTYWSLSDACKKIFGIRRQCLCRTIHCICEGDLQGQCQYGGQIL